MANFLLLFKHVHVNIYQQVLAAQHDNTAQDNRTLGPTESIESAASYIKYSFLSGRTIDLQFTAGQFERPGYWQVAFRHSL